MPVVIFAVPPDFLTWKKRDQNHYVYRQRVKYFDPAKHAKQSGRASERSSVSYRRRRVPVLLEEARNERRDIEEAEVCRAKKLQCRWNFIDDLTFRNGETRQRRTNCEMLCGTSSIKWRGTGATSGSITERKPGRRSLKNTTNTR